MRIGILSDTHDRLERTRTAVKLLMDGGAGVLVHCGDLNGAEIVRACSVCPAYFVFGNNDDPVLVRRAVRANGGTCLEWGGEVALAGKRIAVTHGHVSRELRSLLAAQPDYLLMGHSHELEERREGKTRCINPGALHRASRYSVALLEPETDFVQFIVVPR